jgi:hypothetical protein
MGGKTGVYKNVQNIIIKMSKLDAAWTSADLAKAVCDSLVADGLLKEKPAFIREV